MQKFAADAAKWTVRAAGVLSVALACGGCGTNAVQSVHALRTFEREQVTPALVKQHIDELSNTLGLIRRVLHETKYQPGDAWTQGLALNDASAGKVRSLIVSEAGGLALPSTLAIYKRHVLDVLARTEAARAEAETSYPSIVAALAEVDPALNQLRQDYETEQGLVREVRDAKAEESAASKKGGGYNTMLRAAERSRHAHAQLTAYQAELEKRAGRVPIQNPAARQVIKDAIAATSVCLRLAGEAAAMASLISFEVARLASLPKWEHGENLAVALELIKTGPQQAAQIREDLEVDLVSLEQMLTGLARLDALDIDATPGFAYREGLMDEVVGFTLDLVHVNADAGGEAYFFTPFGALGGRDYAGRTSELRYHIDPILLASARLSASFDLSRLPGAGGLKLGYATNRVYQSGGTIENRSLASELGATGRFSDALDAALLYSGWQSNVRLAHFTSGTIDVVQSATGTVDTSSPFTFTLKEIAFSKELASYGSPNVKSAVVKFGYFDYTLPRIMYQFENQAPEGESPRWVYSGETPVQRVRTQLLTWGAIVNLEFPVVRGLDVLFGFNLSWGFGRQKFYELDAEGERKDRAPFTVALSALSHLGARYRLLGLGSRFRAYVEAVYQAQYLNSSLGTTLGLDGATPIGTHELFHGPHGRFTLSF